MWTWWFMTTVHHDPDITWPYDQDMAITTRILPTQHLWWSTKISWIHFSWIYVSSSSWTSWCRRVHWGFEIFTNGAGALQFLWQGGVQVSCVDTQRMGLSNRILSGLITTAGLVPGSLQHCSNTHLKSLQGPYYEQTSDEYIVTKDYEIAFIRLRFCMMHPLFSI